MSNLQWYNAFAAFKLAVVLEGVYFRFQHGATLGSGFDGIADMVQPLVDRGLRTLGVAAAAAGPGNSTTRER